LEASRAESLEDCAARIMPFFRSVIVPSMQAGNKCLIVSHANTIRTLIKHIDNISDQDIKGMTIPTGIPLLYRLDKNMKPVDPEIEQEFRYMVEPKGYVMQKGSSRCTICVSLEVSYSCALIFVLLF
jgi:bisphosphoglycerate-dependent phosphoglycerate mutase family 1